MNSDSLAMIAVPFMFSWIAWVIFSAIRRYKIAKLQSEVQSRLLDKVGSGQTAAPRFESASHGPALHGASGD
jgi:hypothetical protein